jgi:hypothetical protein
MTILKGLTAECGGSRWVALGSASGVTPYLSELAILVQKPKFHFVNPPPATLNFSIQRCS